MNEYRHIAALLARPQTMMKPGGGMDENDPGAMPAAPREPTIDDTWQDIGMRYRGIEDKRMPRFAPPSMDSRTPVHEPPSRRAPSIYRQEI